MGVSGATLPKDKYVLKKVKVSTIDYQDTRTQMRALGEAVDQDHLDHLAAQYAESQRIDPLDLFWDGRVHKIGDGHHRTQLALNMSLAEVDARVYQGDWQDAALFACNVNDHGMARTDGGVDESVRWLCTGSRWRFESDAWIGQHVGRSRDAVVRSRQRLGIPGGSERARAAIVEIYTAEPDCSTNEVSERLGLPLRTVQRVMSNCAVAHNLASDVIARKEGSGLRSSSSRGSQKSTTGEVRPPQSSEQSTPINSPSSTPEPRDDVAPAPEPSSKAEPQHTPVTPSVTEAEPAVHMPPIEDVDGEDFYVVEYIKEQAPALAKATHDLMRNVERFIGRLNRAKSLPSGVGKALNQIMYVELSVLYAELSRAHPVQCVMCQGSGELDGEDCPYCQGHGWNLSGDSRDKGVRL